MTLREEALNTEIKEWDQDLQTSTSQAAEKTKEQEETIKKISASARKAVQEVKKEKARADEVVQAVKVLNKSLELAKMTEDAYKKALDGLGKDKQALKDQVHDLEGQVHNLEGQVDILKADVQMSKDLLVQKQVDETNESMTPRRRPLTVPGIASGQPIPES